ncbi:uncharacterized protein [Nicotiana tomentosiformis]|uniref:uncharacterized protein n=1 Tax=Nicotiana tomentosiformis TaxID=4098 RepID=UPI00051C95A7|nr:uncharacterized protein LOC104101767 [Nicotiana tomentosiformis]
MARNIPTLHLYNKLSLLPPSITYFVTVLLVFAIISMVAFLCGVGAHKREKEKKKSVQLGGKKPVGRLESNISSTKALLMAKMISWRKEQDEDDNQPKENWEDENALWKRTIIKGEKCRPLDFSGKISYDAKGNMVLD